jgi:predicted Fe-Mo cluster-binding NifX family protein
MKIKLACATDDRINFTKEHFGEAKTYLIYEMNLENGELKFLEERKNTSSEEETHGDPKKAKEISDLLNDIQVLVAFAMGPNVVRMRKRFVPIISRILKIQDALEKIKPIKEEIKKEIEKPKGEDREIIFIKEE